MKMKLLLASVILSGTLFGCASSGPSMQGGQQVFFVGIADGAVVRSPVNVKFGVSGLTVKPALEDIENKNAGHHHLLVNLDSLPEGQAIPFTDQHIHFGKGQTEADVILPPGRYKLTMQFANGAHVSYGKRLSQTITITVQ
jgi:Domain of unknown function (DUF4399)